MELTNDQRILLQAIGERDGKISWYVLGRACLADLSSPAAFALKPLRELGLVEERSVEGEPLPRLWLTAKGRDIWQKLRSSQLPGTIAAPRSSRPSQVE